MVKQQRKRYGRTTEEAVLYNNRESGMVGQQRKRYCITTEKAVW